MASTIAHASDSPAVDPVALLKGFVSLRRLTGMYPAGHPAIEQKLAELDGAIQHHLASAPSLHLDVIHGQPHVDGICFRADGDAASQIFRELAELGVDSIHIARGVSRDELLALSEFLWQMRDATARRASMSTSLGAGSITSASDG